MEFLKDIAIPQSLEHFRLLVLMTTVSSIVFLPYLGFVAGSSFLSLLYHHRGSRDKNAVFIRFAHELIDRALFSKSLIVFLAILPGLSLVFAYAQILHGTQSTAASLAGFGFLFLLAGMVLLYSYKYTFRVQLILGSYELLLQNQPNDRSQKALAAYQDSNTKAHLRSGRYGIFFLCLALILYASAMSVLSNPRAWDLDSVFSFILSPDIVLKISEIIFLSIGITGIGILYFSFALGNRKDYTEEYSALAKKIGIRFSIVGLLGLPASVVLSIAVTSDEALSGSIYLFASTAVIFLFLSAHFIYGYFRSPQPISLTVGFAMFLFAAGLLVIGDNLAVGTATRSQAALLANIHDQSMEQLKTTLGMVTVSFTGEGIYNTRCESCHLFDKKKVGPPYYETIPKYQGKKTELISFILHPVKKNPDYPPMQNPGLQQAEADSIASYILRRVALSLPRGTR
jgi:cytochrome c551/c552